MLGFFAIILLLVLTPKIRRRTLRLRTLMHTRLIFDFRQIFPVYSWFCDNCHCLCFAWNYFYFGDVFADNGATVLGLSHHFNFLTCHFWREKFLNKISSSHRLSGHPHQALPVHQYRTEFINLRLKRSLIGKYESTSSPSRYELIIKNHYTTCNAVW